MHTREAHQCCSLEEVVCLSIQQLLSVCPLRLRHSWDWIHQIQPYSLGILLVADWIHQTQSILLEVLRLYDIQETLPTCLLLYLVFQECTHAEEDSKDVQPHN